MRSKGQRQNQIAGVLVIGALVCGLLAGTAAAATYTTIGSPPGGEATHLQILNHIYGVTFTQSGLDYSSVTVTATRIADLGGNTPIDIATGGVGDMDQVWQDGTVWMHVEAKFAGYSQKFGYFAGAGPAGAYTNSFDVIPGVDNYSPTQSAYPVLVMGPGAQWRWGRNGDGGVFSSLEADNTASTSGRQDHMVTYKITGLTTTDTTWLLFWEDMTNGSDWDFNDLVVQVSTAEVGGAVPEPLTVASAFFAVAGLGAYIRRRTGRAVA